MVSGPDSVSIEYLNENNALSDHSLSLMVNHLSFAKDISQLLVECQLTTPEAHHTITQYLSIFNYYQLHTQVEFLAFFRHLCLTLSREMIGVNPGYFTEAFRSMFSSLNTPDTIITSIQHLQNQLQQLQSIPLSQTSINLLLNAYHIGDEDTLASLIPAIEYLNENNALSDHSLSLMVNHLSFAKEISQLLVECQLTTPEAHHTITQYLSILTITNYILKLNS